MTANCWFNRYWLVPAEGGGVVILLKLMIRHQGTRHQTSGLYLMSSWKNVLKFMVETFGSHYQYRYIGTFAGSMTQICTTPKFPKSHKTNNPFPTAQIHNIDIVLLILQ